MDHKPFLLSVSFKTPLLIPANQHLPTLDAVIAGQIALQTGNDQYALDEVAGLFAHTDATPHGSQLLTSLPGKSNLISIITGRGNTCREASADGIPIPSKYEASRLSYKVGKGRTRKGKPGENEVSSLNMLAVSAGLFLATGDVEVICELFETISHMGKKRTQGWGEIDTIEGMIVDEDPTTWGLCDRALRPVRPVPFQIYDRIPDGPGSTIDVVRSRPFYWSDATPYEPCIVPMSSLFEDFDLGLGEAPRVNHLGVAAPSAKLGSAVEIVATALSCMLDAGEATGNPEDDALRAINKSYAYDPPKLDRNKNEVRRPLGPAYGFLARNDGTASATSNHREWGVLNPYQLGPTGLDQHLIESLENPDGKDLVLYFGDKPSAKASDLHVTRSASDIVHICGPAGRTKQVSRRSYRFLRDVLS